MWYYKSGSEIKPVKPLICTPCDGDFHIGYKGSTKIVAYEFELFPTKTEAYEAYKLSLLARYEKLKAEIQEIDNEISRINQM